MILLGAGVTVLLMVVVGLAMFRCLARPLLAGRHGQLSETDLLLLGTLPALALVGTLATYLSLFHLLRFGFVLFLAIVILYVGRREVYAMLASLCANAVAGFVQAGRGNLFPLLAVFAFGAAVVAGLLLSVISSGNVDVWVYHIPFAQSLIVHHGFAVPQLNNLPFYSNQPMLFETLFATAMLAVPDFAAADAVNIAILMGFVLLLLSFAKRARDVQFLVLCYFFFEAGNYLLGAAEPMTDLPRSCFSAAAYLFAYRYACNLRCFDLTMSALMAGAAVAGKYTELVTPLFICLAVAPVMLSTRHTWFHMVPSALVFVAVTAVWYVKNAILVGNPIYPFLFSHPGLSNQWMDFYMRDMARAFNVADRAYSTNLWTVQGWRDFAHALSAYFMPLAPAVIIAVMGLALPAPRRWMLPLWCLVLCVFWYGMMFNGPRWALTAMLLIMAAAFVTWAPVADRIATAWNPQWPAMALGRLGFGLRRFSDPMAAAASLVVVLVVCFGLVRLGEGYGHSWLPRWMDRDLAVALVHPGRMEAYLGDTKPGYAMYRYIGRHNLAPVLQPFDNGAVSYASAYNGGHANDWVLPYDRLPKSVEQIDPFVVRNRIRYFINGPSLDATAIDRLGGAAHVGLAHGVIARLKRHARLIYSDGHGMSLYQIMPENFRP